MSRWQSLFVLLILPLSLMARAAAEEPKSEKPGSDAERARHLEKMRAVAGSIRVLADPKREESVVKLKEEPVLRYADSTRQTNESSLWIWSSGGRPTAIVAIEYYPMGPMGPRWLYEIASLSTERIAAECEGHFRWTAKEPGIPLQTLTGCSAAGRERSPAAGADEGAAGRFTAYENSTFSGRLEMRPLVTPLLRYSAPKEGLIDGAIFALANGTNPEVLLVLEAQELKGKSEWRYALVQMTGEPLTVQLDGKEVWKQEGAYPPTVRAGYINGWIETKKDDK